jgi:two-component system, NtrC family, response regulator AtoC
MDSFLGFEDLMPPSTASRDPGAPAHVARLQVRWDTPPVAAPTFIDQEGEPQPDGDGGRQLLVMGPDVSACIDLPEEGQVRIGRAEDADVRIVDPLASRNHARLLVGPTIEIEDLDSANGTLVGGKRLVPRQPLPLGPGDSISIGGTILVVQQGGRRPRTRRVWSNGYLEGRLIEECARAEKGRGSFALLRVHLDSTAIADAERILLAALRIGDVLASYGPHDYHVLLVDTGGPEAQALAADIGRRLSEAGIANRCVAALYPADGATPGALVGHGCATAGATVDVAASGAAGVIVADARMKELYALAERAAAGMINVLILGETGVGKEVLADFIHQRSARRGRPFLSVNCAALAESLLESELFGHEKGAFTGAGQAKVGLLEAADGGTLFLDEVGETSLQLQAKLLRALETRQVLRVGATRPRAVDVRFLAATNRDLEEEVAAKTFRQDLYFRLNGISVMIPPLRERADEIEPLAKLFLGSIAEGLRRSPPRISPEALGWLRAYPWPGNIRELRNVMERALLFCSGDEIGLKDLPSEKRQRPSLAPPTGAAPSNNVPLPWTAQAARDAERQAIIEALARCAGNQTRAAELLGIPRRTFCTRMKEYNLPRPRTE